MSPPAGDVMSRDTGEHKQSVMTCHGVTHGPGSVTTHIETDSSVRSCYQIILFHVSLTKDEITPGSKLWSTHPATLNLNHIIRSS